VQPEVSARRAVRGPVAQLLALASPQEDERSRATIHQLFGSTDPDAELDLLYPLLVEHRVLAAALARLEREGADLEGLTISAELFRSHWPLGALLPAPEESAPGRMPLAALRRRLQAHKELLRETLITIVDAAPDAPYVVLGGRAYEAAYPEYRDRFEHDVDIHTEDMGTALRLLAVLRSGMGYAMYRARASRIGTGWLAKLATFRLSQEGHEVHVDLLVGGRPAGSGRLLLWARQRFEPRSREIGWRGRRLLVPAAEDLLVTTAMEVHRRGRLIRRDLNDVHALLVADGHKLDWDHVKRAAVDARVQGEVHRLVTAAVEELGTPAPPSSEMASLMPTAVERRVLDRAVRVEQERERVATGAGTVIAARRRRVIVAAPDLWLLSHVRRSPLVAGSARFVPVARIDAFVFGLRLRAARAGAGWFLALPLLRRRALRFGSLCELRAAPPEGAQFCLARSAHGPGSLRGADPETVQVIQSLVQALPLRAEQEAARIKPAEPGQAWVAHRCAGFLFSIRGGSGRTIR